MTRGLWLFAVAALLFGCEETTVVIEDETPDIIIEHIYHTIVEEDTTPDVIIIEDTTPDIIVLEDNTPDVVQEFYSDAADLPVLIWNVGGQTPMPKKLRDLNSGVAIVDIVHGDALGVDQLSSGDSMFIEYQHFTLPTNFIGGLICSNDTDTDHDVNILAGSCRDDGDAENMKLSAEITKQIDAVWVAGDDNGGLDTGTVGTNLMYGIWAIKNPTTGVVDAIFSLSFATPAMPAGFTLKRLIGAIRTGASDNIWQFRQSGEYFAYLYDASGSATSPQDVNDATLTANTFETGTLSAPPHALVDIMARVGNAGGSAAVMNIFIRPLPSGGVAAGNYNLMQNLQGTGISNVDAFGGRCNVLADSSKQFEYATNEPTGASTIVVYTMGFHMGTRREPQ